MTKTFGSIVFTPVVRELQQRYGSRRQYERMESQGALSRGLGSLEQEYIGERDSFYMASIGSTGWPYVQHRGGMKGFLKVIDDQTIAFADYRGNKQYITTGNLETDDRVALIFVDYPRQARLKILGHVTIYDLEQAGDWLHKVRDDGYDAVIERVYVIHVEAFDWNCSQHITPRFTTEEIRSVLEPFEAQIEELMKENQRLQNELAKR